MAANVIETAGDHISKVNHLRQSWEKKKSELDEIEMQLEQLCNGKATATKKVKSAKTAAKAKKGPGRPKGSKLNKANEIRVYYEKHPDARSKDIIAALAKRDITVSAASIWQAVNNKPTGKKAKTAKKAKDKKASTRQSLTSIVTKILEKNKNGLTLHDIVERVIKADYKTKSQKTLSQVVMNALTKMRSDNTITKNEEKKTYIAAAKKAA